MRPPPPEQLAFQTRQQAHARSFFSVSRNNSGAVIKRSADGRQALFTTSDEEPLFTLRDPENDKLRKKHEKEEKTRQEIEKEMRSFVQNKGRVMQKRRKKEDLFELDEQADDARRQCRALLGGAISKAGTELAKVKRKFEKTNKGASRNFVNVALHAHDMTGKNELQFDPVTKNLIIPQKNAPVLVNIPSGGVYQSKLVTASTALFRDYGRKVKNLPEKTVYEDASEKPSRELWRGAGMGGLQIPLPIPGLDYYLPNTEGGFDEGAERGENDQRQQVGPPADGTQNSSKTKPKKKVTSRQLAREKRRAEKAQKEEEETQKAKQALFEEPTYDERTAAALERRKKKLASRLAARPAMYEEQEKRENEEILKVEVQGESDLKVEERSDPKEKTLEGEALVTTEEAAAPEDKDEDPAFLHEGIWDTEYLLSAGEAGEGRIVQTLEAEKKPPENVLEKQAAAEEPATGGAWAEGAWDEPTGGAWAEGAWDDVPTGGAWGEGAWDPDNPHEEEEKVAPSPEVPTQALPSRSARSSSGAQEGSGDDDSSEEEEESSSDEESSDASPVQQKPLAIEDEPEEEKPVEKTPAELYAERMRRTHERREEVRQKQQKEEPNETLRDVVEKIAPPPPEEEEKPHRLKDAVQQVIEKKIKISPAEEERRKREKEEERRRAEKEAERMRKLAETEKNNNFYFSADGKNFAKTANARPRRSSPDSYHGFSYDPFDKEAPLPQSVGRAHRVWQSSRNGFARKWDARDRKRSKEARDNGEDEYVKKQPTWTEREKWLSQDPTEYCFGAGEFYDTIIDLKEADARTGRYMTGRLPGRYLDAPKPDAPASSEEDDDALYIGRRREMFSKSMSSSSKASSAASNSSAHPTEGPNFSAERAEKKKASVTLDPGDPAKGSGGAPFENPAKEVDSEFLHV